LEESKKFGPSLKDIKEFEELMAKSGSKVKSKWGPSKKEI
jgi:hypothetical protein